MEQQKDIEKRLKQYASRQRQLHAAVRKEEKIQELLQIKPLLQTRGSYGDFILEQAGHLGRYCLVWQAAWLVLFHYLLTKGVDYLFLGNNGNEVLVLMSLLPSVLVLITVEDITKVYQRSMLEIEHVTKYSLYHAVLIRMLILSIMHSAILTAGIIWLHASMDSSIGKLLVYGFTPMAVMTGALMKLMQYMQGDKLKAAGVALYVAVVIAVVVGNTEYFDWYQPDYFKIWCLLCAAGMLFGCCHFIS